MERPSTLKLSMNLPIMSIALFRAVVEWISWAEQTGSGTTVTMGSFVRSSTEA